MTTELTKAAQQALEALRNAQQLEHLVDRKMQRAAIAALERALTQRPQAVPMTDEPVKVVPYTEWHRGDVLRITSEGRDIGPFEVGQLVRHDDEDGDSVPYCRSLNGDYRYALIHDQLEFVSTEARHGIAAPAGGEG